MASTTGEMRGENMWSSGYLLKYSTNHWMSRSTLGPPVCWVSPCRVWGPKYAVTNKAIQHPEIACI